MSVASGLSHPEATTAPDLISTHGDLATNVDHRVGERVMHHDCGVSHCDLSTQDVICPTCTTELVAALTAIATGGVHRIRYHKDWDAIRKVHVPRPPVTEYHPGLWEDLETTLTRQAKMGPQSLPVRGKGEIPLMFHEAASDVRSEVLRAVRHWKAVFLAANTHLHPPRDGVPEVCRWMATFPGLLAALPAAPNMHDDFWTLAGASRHPEFLGSMYRVINSAPNRLFLGICSARVEGEEFPCDADVFGLAGRDWAVCRRCGTEHDVAYRRGKLLEAVGREVVNSVRASRLLASFGIKLPSSTIRSWTQRRTVRGKVIEPRLEPHGHDETGKPLYLIQRILDVWIASLEKKGNAA